MGPLTNGAKEALELALGNLQQKVREPSCWERPGLLPGLRGLLACPGRRFSGPSLTTRKLPSRGSKTGSPFIAHLSAREAVAQFRKCDLERSEVLPDLTS